MAVVSSLYKSVKHCHTIDIYKTFKWVSSVPSVCHIVHDKTNAIYNNGILEHTALSGSKETIITEQLFQANHSARMEYTKIPPQMLSGEPGMYEVDRQGYTGTQA